VPTTDDYDGMQQDILDLRSDVATLHAIIGEIVTGLDLTRREIDRVGVLLHGVEPARPVAAAANGTETKKTASGNPLPPPKRKFNDVTEWVEGWLMPNIERRISNTKRWCGLWHEHREVVHRFNILWRSWEQVVADKDPLLLSDWYTDHLDKHLTAIFSSDGPFAACSPDRHSPRRRLDGRPPEPVTLDLLGHRPAAAPQRDRDDVAITPDSVDLDPDRTQEVRTP
jgi:hypothetical protein